MVSKRSNGLLKALSQSISAVPMKATKKYCSLHKPSELYYQQPSAGDKKRNIAWQINTFSMS
jgi:hypothetical protein